MTRATCTDCGSRFERDPSEAWKVRCYACWKRSKADATPGETAAQLRSELREAIEEAAELRARLQSLERQSSIPGEMLGRLIRLCHPDRHAGSEAATLATQWLLKQRESCR